jgi:pyridoxine 4-dehydrogenase
VLRFDEPDELRRGIEDNLRTLRTDRLAAVNLRLMDSGPPDARFDAQLAAMIKARDEGLVAGIGLSNVWLAHLQRALELTEIVCVQNLFSLINRDSTDVLRVCTQRGIAFVPYAPLGWPRAESAVIVDNPTIRQIAQRYNASPAQIALAWLAKLSDYVLLIPGTASRQHLLENIAVDDIDLDQEAMSQLDVAFA